MQTSEKVLSEQRAKEINRCLLQGDKIDQDKDLGIGSVMSHHGIGGMLHRSFSRQAVDELLEIKMILKDLR